MATQTRWIYPPAWDGTYPTQFGFHRGAVMLLADEDDTSEDAATKIQRSNLLTLTGREPRAIAVDRIDYDIAGYDQIKLYFDDGDNTPIAVLGSGAGSIDFDSVGGITSPNAAPTAPDDGFTGDIMITSTLASEASGSYSIMLSIRPKD